MGDAMNAPTLNELNLLHASICQALADPKRLLLLYKLAERPLPVNALVDALDLPQSTVSRHLRLLREQSLVETERNGNSVVYSLADGRIIEALNLIQQVMVDALTRKSQLI
jgi:DNA-binding transcriptional ArsR family regulator